MVGAFIRAGVVCPRCDTTVPLNALVPAVRCPACGERLPLETDDWEAVLGDLPQEAPGLEEGEGSRSSILGSYSFTVSRGRMEPRYAGTSEPIETEDVLRALAEGELRGPGDGEQPFVRPVPERYRDLLPGVLALVGEDPGLVSGSAADRELDVDQGSTRPVAFSCPSCGGYLVAEGRGRTAVCDHCGGESAIPDRLWERIHPSCVMRTWFLLLDSSPNSAGWSGDTYAAVPDGSGGAVLAVADGEGPPLLLGTDPKGEVEWSRRIFDSPLSELGHPRLAPSARGTILAWRRDRPDLTVISPADGRDLDVVEGTEPESAADWEGFTMLGCLGLAAFRDSMVLCSGPWRDGEGRKQFRLLRFSPGGRPMELWPGGRPGGILGRLFGRCQRLDRFVECGHRPQALRDGVRLAAGPDGSLFMLQRNLLAKFGPAGRKLFLAELPDGYSEGDPVVDAAGRCWVLIHGADHETTLVSVSSDGRTISEESFTDDSDHPLYFASAAAPVTGGVLTAGWSGGLFLHETAGTMA